MQTPKIFFDRITGSTGSCLAQYYEGEKVGEFTADIVVENSVILELKSVKRIVVAHEAQLVDYLVATGKEVGLLLNFGERKVEVKEKNKNL